MEGSLGPVFNQIHSDLKRESRCSYADFYRICACNSARLTLGYVDSQPLVLR